jgi:hypothetical protein
MSLLFESCSGQLLAWFQLLLLLQRVSYVFYVCGEQGAGVVRAECNPA